MANNFTSNPWIIDTAGATVLSNDLLRVRGVRWVGGTTAGHQAIITNAAGKVMWESLASGANNVEADNIQGSPGANWAGLVVPTLGSGRLYIELL